MAASRILRTSTATIGKSTVCTLLKKTETIINKAIITHVCIDDFALKRREKYGTVMIDIHTHTIIDMIASREQKEVVTWLKSYANLQVVSRDGSITYRNAISQAHPEAIQVSDRFHLYKNLTNYAIEYLKKHLKVVIQVAVDIPEIKVDAIELSQDNDNRKLTLEQKYQKILLLQASDENNCLW